MGACGKLLLFTCTNNSSKSILLEKFTGVEDFLGSLNRECLYPVYTTGYLCVRLFVYVFLHLLSNNSVIKKIHISLFKIT